MAGICFKSERGGWMQDQWSWVFSNFGITEIWERSHPDSDADIYQDVVEIDTCAELPEDRPIIVLAPPDGRYIKGTQSLQGFDHPEDAIYVFGGSYSNLSNASDLGGRVPDALVYIPTVKLECYSSAAAYMTMWDRYMKRGGFG